MPRRRRAGRARAASSTNASAPAGENRSPKSSPASARLGVQASAGARRSAGRWAARRRRSRASSRLIQPASRSASTRSRAQRRRSTGSSSDERRASPCSDSHHGRSGAEAGQRISAQRPAAAVQGRRLPAGARAGSSTRRRSPGRRARATPGRRARGGQRRGAQPGGRGSTRSPCAALRLLGRLVAPAPPTSRRTRGRPPSAATATQLVVDLARLEQVAAVGPRRRRRAARRAGAGRARRRAPRAPPARRAAPWTSASAGSSSTSLGASRAQQALDERSGAQQRRERGGGAPSAARSSARQLEVGRGRARRTAPRPRAARAAAPGRTSTVTRPVRLVARERARRQHARLGDVVAGGDDGDVHHARHLRIEQACRQGGRASRPAITSPREARVARCVARGAAARVGRSRRASARSACEHRGQLLGLRGQVVLARLEVPSPRVAERRSRRSARRRARSRASSGWCPSPSASGSAPTSASAEHAAQEARRRRRRRGRRCRACARPRTPAQRCRTMSDAHAFELVDEVAADRGSTREVGLVPGADEQREQVVAEAERAPGARAAAPVGVNGDRGRVGAVGHLDDALAGHAVELGRAARRRARRRRARGRRRRSRRPRARAPRSASSAPLRGARVHRRLEVRLDVLRLVDQRQAGPAAAARGAAYGWQATTAAAPRAAAASASP